MTQTQHSSPLETGFRRLTDTLKSAFGAEEHKPKNKPSPLDAQPDIRVMLREVQRVLKQEEFSVPVFPAVAQQVMSQINDPRIGGAEIAQAIESDTALAAQILKVANSAAFSSGRQIVTVQRAIAQLGLNRIRSVLFAVVRNNMFPRGYHRELHTAYFQQALATAAATEAIGPLVKVKVDQRFLYGLLHNIGKPCMLNVIGQMQARGELPREIDDDTTRAMIELTYEVCGVILAHRWKLPEGFREVLRYHRTPHTCEGAHRDAALMTNLAISVCATWGVGYPRDPLNVVFNSPYVTKLGLNPTDLDHVGKDTAERYEALTATFS